MERGLEIEVSARPWVQSPFCKKKHKLSCPISGNLRPQCPGASTAKGLERKRNSVSFSGKKKKKKKEEGGGRRGGERRGEEEERNNACKAKLNLGTPVMAAN